MTVVEQPVRFLTPTTAFAAVATVAVGLVQGLAQLSGLRAALVASCGLAVALLTSAGFAWAEAVPGRPLKAVQAAAVLFGCLAVLASGGVGYVMLMPVVSTGVLFLGLRGAVLVAAISIASFGAARSLSGQPIFEETLGVTSAVLFVGIFSQFARRERYARREVERLSAQVEELAAARERNRISRELHDSLGHVLTVANVQLEAAIASPEGREARLLNAQGLLKGGLGELRRTLSFIRESPEAPTRFPIALAELVAQTQATGLQVALETVGTPRALPSDVGFTLFRGAQEALTNVHRHARATRVTVQLHYGPQRVVLRIADDGCGTASLLLGHGLTGLEERMAAINGALSLASAEPRGLAVTLEVPA